jgi:hypothetical protein
MAINYDHAKYGVKTRKWFGLMKRFGGDGPNSTGGFAQSSGVDTAHVEQWYPPGPIEIKKVGYFIQNSLGGASRARLEIQFKTNDGNDSIAVLRPTSTTVTSKTFASTVTLTTDYCTTGSYIAIIGATPHTAAQGSTLNYNAVTGTLAFFIDYVPKFDASKWND